MTCWQRNLSRKREILDRGARQNAVGYGKHSAFWRAQPGGAKADVLDDTDLIVYPADIPDDDDLVKQNRNAAKHVFKCLLCAETEGQAADAYTRERRADIDAQGFQECETHEKENDDFHKAAHQRNDGALGVQASMAKARSHAP